MLSLHLPAAPKRTRFTLEELLDDYCAPEVLEGDEAWCVCQKKKRLEDARHDHC